MSEHNPYATPQAQVADPLLTGGPAELAGRGTRLGAALIDGAIGFGVSWPIFSALGIWQQARSPQAQDPSFLLTVLVLGVLLFLALHGYLLKKNGQTIGKRLLGIRIVTLEGDVPPFGKLIGLRYLPLMVVSVIPIPLIQIAGLIDALFIFRADRRCVHDLMAGTRVIVARTSQVST